MKLVIKKSIRIEILRPEVKAILQSLVDLKLIVIKEIIMEESIAGYNIDGTPITSSELGKLLDVEEKKIDKGEFITVQEMRKETKKWSQAIK